MKVIGPTSVRVMVFLVLVAPSAHANKIHELVDGLMGLNAKYVTGDCITPTEESWSWFKAYASVMGRFKRLDGEYLDGPNVYQLRMVESKGPWLMYRDWNPNMYSQSQIDDFTMKVPDHFCEVENQY